MNNYEIETCVISALLKGGYTPDAADVIATLNESAFSSPYWRKVYAEIKRQARQRNMIDAAMIAEALGDDYFASVMDVYRTAPSAANLKGYARVVSAYEKIGNFKEQLTRGLQAIETAPNHEFALNRISEFFAALGDIDRPGTEIKPVHITELLDGYTDLLERRLKHGDESDTLKTGIPELDKITGGINAVDLIVVAARPGMGKTEFALKVAEGVASQRVPGGEGKRGVLVFSMEMSNMQIVERQLASAGHMPVSALRNPAKMDDEHWGRVSTALGRLQGLDVWVVDASALNVEQIRAIAERHKRNNPHLSLILVDYLGLIEKPRAERNDLAIGHISGSLKRMAKDLLTPVMSLSQLSRDVEKRPIHQRRPTNSDLRDSGSIEQDADSIIMLYREGVYDEHSPAAGLAEIIVTKNRFGELGTVYQAFAHGHFTPIDQAHAETLARSRNQRPAAHGRGRGDI